MWQVRWTTASGGHSVHRLRLLRAGRDRAADAKPVRRERQGHFDRRTSLPKAFIHKAFFRFAPGSSAGLLVPNIL